MMSQSSKESLDQEKNSLEARVINFYKNSYNYPWESWNNVRKNISNRFEVEFNKFNKKDKEEILNKAKELDITKYDYSFYPSVHFLKLCKDVDKDFASRVLSLDEKYSEITNSELLLRVLKIEKFIYYYFLIIGLGSIAVMFYLLISI